MTRPYGEHVGLGSNLHAEPPGLAVERVNSMTGIRTLVEHPRRDAVNYLTDGRGTIRVMEARSVMSSGYADTRVRFLYRKPGALDWNPLSVGRDDEPVPSDFVPAAVDPDKNVAYGFGNHDGFKALFSAALDGTAKRELVLARPNTDVDELLTIGRQHRVVGVSYATERREVEYFDPGLKALRNALSKALPNAPLVDIIDADADEKKLLLYAGGDTNPGTYYLLDRSTKQMVEILPARPLLAGRTLAPVKPITFPAADGTKIPAYLTLPPGSDGRNIPAIVMPHGGPGARDEWGFDWWAQFFAARGFAVLQPNFRGSTGYGQAWFQKNGFQGWRTAIGDVVDAGRWLKQQGIAAPGKLAIVGWSYGGYAALQSAVLDPDLYKAVIAVAPVTDLALLKEEARRYMNSTETANFVGDGPHVIQGSPARNAAAFKAPVLMFHGTEDRNVDINQSQLMTEKLRGAGKQADLVIFKGLDHQLDDSDARTLMLTKSDEFLRAQLGLKP
jgi:dipeptidyl aminopeptidase/acylaminoacyl peptidase